MSPGSIVRSALGAAITLSPALCVPGSTAAQPPPNASVRVRVVELAGGRAYLTPGTAAEVRPGAVAVIRGQRLRVVEANRTHAVVLVEGRAIRVGDVGQTERGLQEVDEGAPEVVRLATPRALPRFRGIWPRAERPAHSQHPQRVQVPLVQPARPVHVVLQESSGLVVPFGGTRGASAWGELRLRARAERWAPWLGLNTDVAARGWADPGRGEWLRPPADPSLVVRALELRLGNAASLHARAGRLPWAAEGAGMLDGVRVQVPVLPGLTIAAFGGAVPDPVTTDPALLASRFGVEAHLDDPDVPLAPELAAVVQGSIFAGTLDERRLLVAARLRPTNATLSATTELDLFAPNDPSGATSLELRHASLDGEVRIASFRVGGRLARELPERSWLLRSRLPAEWACSTPSSTSDAAPAACGQPDAAALFGAGHAWLDLASIDVGAGAHVWALGGALDAVGGFVTGRFRGLASVGRLEAAVSGNRTAWLDTLALRAAAGAALFQDAVDGAVYYRPAFNSSEVEPAAWIEHAVGLEATVALGGSVTLTLLTEVRRAPGETDLAVQTNASWSP